MLAAAALIGSAGCASAGFDGRVYKHGPLHFSLGEPPSSWRAIQVSDALAAFRDDQGQATIAINGRCGADGDDVPLQALTQHLFLTFTDRQVKEQQVLPMAGREALRTVMHAKLDGVSKGFAVYVLKKDGCVYDFLLIAEPGSFDRSLGAFDQYVRSFQTLGSAGKD